PRFLGFSENPGLISCHEGVVEPASNRKEVVGFDTEGNELKILGRPVFSTSAMNLVCTRIFEVDAVLEKTGPYISRLQFQVVLQTWVTGIERSRQAPTTIYLHARYKH
ncbi:MAG: hypothetical protein LQ349_007521, partial [Xanthoria aureola]